MWLIDQPKAGLLIQVPVINALHQDSPSCFNTARHVGILVSGIKEKDWKTIAKDTLSTNDGHKVQLVTFDLVWQGI